MGYVIGYRNLPEQESIRLGLRMLRPLHCTHVSRNSRVKKEDIAFVARTVNAPLSAQMPRSMRTYRSPNLVRDNLARTPIATRETQAYTMNKGVVIAARTCSGYSF